jgi:glycolate oxidase
MLLVESDAPGGAAAAELEAAERAMHAAGATLVVRSADATEADALRQARRLAYEALERRGTIRMSEDLAVPRSRVPELLAAIERIAASHGVRCATFGHAGDGNLHPHLLFDRDDPEARRRSMLVQDELLRATLDLGGTISAEHGIGVVRREWLPIQRGEGAVAAMRAIKGALDPLGILNPGRVL